MQNIENNNATVTTDAYFGGCPQCGDCLSVNVHKSHYGICEAHKVFWPIGSNLFSSWRHEDESIWRKNAALLQGFTEVKPIYPPDDQPTTGGKEEAIGEAAMRELEIEPPDFPYFDPVEPMRAPELEPMCDNCQRQAAHKRKEDADAQLKKMILDGYSTRQSQRLIRYDADPHGLNVRQVYSLANVENMAVVIQPDADKSKVVSWLIQLTAYIARNGVAEYPEPKDPVAYLNRNRRPIRDDDDNEIPF